MYASQRLLLRSCHSHGPISRRAGAGSEDGSRQPRPAYSSSAWASKGGVAERVNLSFVTAYHCAALGDD